MSEVRGLRLAPSVAQKEKRLAGLLGGRTAGDPVLCDTIADAQLLGSLELAGVSVSWDEVRQRGSGEAIPPEVAAFRRAQRAVDPAAPLTTVALEKWHDAAVGGSRLRDTDRPPLAPGAPPPAPVAFIEGRLAILEQWLGAESGGELKPAQAGALVLARIVEILPFADGNGRVSRLAASHVMVRGGMRPPILVAGDRPRLQACLLAAFRLDTEPLTALLQDASDRCLDVMIQTLEAGGRTRG